MKDGSGVVAPLNKKMAQIVHIVKTITSAYMTVLFIGMGLVLAASIVLRFFFDQPIVWANTVTRYAYIHIVLLGTAISYIEGSHAQIDVLFQRAPEKIKLAFNLIHYSTMLFLCGVLTIVGGQHVVNMWNVHSPILADFPVGAVYLAVPVSAVIMILYISWQIISLKASKEG